MGLLRRMTYRERIEERTLQAKKEYIEGCRNCGQDVIISVNTNGILIHCSHECGWYNVKKYIPIYLKGNNVIPA